MGKSTINGHVQSCSIATLNYQRVFFSNRCSNRGGAELARVEFTHVLTVTSARRACRNSYVVFLRASHCKFSTQQSQTKTALGFSLLKGNAACMNVWRIASKSMLLFPGNFFARDNASKIILQDPWVRAIYCTQIQHFFLHIDLAKQNISRNPSPQTAPFNPLYFHVFPQAVWSQLGFSR